MAKATKKTVTRSTTSAAKHTRSSLVRVTPVAEAQAEAREHEEATNAAMEGALKKPVAVPTTTPKRATPTLSIPTKAAAKNAVAAQAAAAQAAQAVRRGKALVRSATPRPTVRAENYGYVMRDLRFIAVLAILVVIIMVVLKIVIKS